MTDTKSEATLQELVDQVIWESVMSYTAHTGLTERTRLGLVESVRDSVRWAIAQKMKTQDTGGADK